MNKYDIQHLRNLGALQKQINAIYNAAAEEAAAIGQLIPTLPADAIFAFKDYPMTHDRIRELLRYIYAQTFGTIENGINVEWALANNKNDALVRRIFGDISALTEQQQRKYLANNNGARAAFISRQTEGLNLSERVWRYANDFKSEIELGIDIGIRDGRDARGMARDLKQYLRHPDKLFRRVRDEHGNLQLSKAAAAFHPGRGVYRSSYKNALRLAVTETNMAYRTADQERWKDFDFVVGQRVCLSPTNHPVADICDELKGEYPKDFKFVGWHPHCRCYVESILKSDKELKEDMRRIIRGEQPTDDSANTVRDTPPNFDAWVKDNQARIELAKTPPYFIRDNRTRIDDILNGKAQPAAKGVLSKPTTLEDIQKEYSVGFWKADEATFYNGAAAKFDYLSVNRQVNEALTAVGITDIRTPSLYIQDNRFSIDFQGYLGREEFYLNREFYYRGNDRFIVEHTHFLLPCYAQGKGVSKKILGIFFEQYKRMGVDEIRVCANLSVGGYTWARYGFYAIDKAEALQAIRKKALTAEEFQEARHIVDDYYKKNGLSKKEPFPMHLIADNPWGKKALLISRWEGVLKIKDPAHVARFEKYLRS